MLREEWDLRSYKKYRRIVLRGLEWDNENFNNKIRDWERKDYSGM